METYDPDRSRAVLFGVLAKFVIWSQDRAPQELIEEAALALAQAGTVEAPIEIPNAA